MNQAQRKERPLAYPSQNIFELTPTLQLRGYRCMPTLLTINVPLLLVSELAYEIDDWVVYEEFHPPERVKTTPFWSSMISSIETERFSKTFRFFREANFLRLLLTLRWVRATSSAICRDTGAAKTPDEKINPNVAKVEDAADLRCRG